MARRRYFRRSVRVVAAKKKWASNIRQSIMRQGGSNPVADYIPLVVNSTETATPTPVVIKTGNFKVSVDCIAQITNTVAASINAVLFIAFLPQGYGYNTASATQGRDLIQNHPEWVMAWKQVDFSSATGSATTSTVTANFSSRLKRNLNSGDRIIFGVAYGGGETAPTTGSTGNIFTFSVTCQYWTCAN